MCTYGFAVIAYSVECCMFKKFVAAALTLTHNHTSYKLSVLKRFFVLILKKEDFTPYYIISVPL